MLFSLPLRVGELGGRSHGLPYEWPAIRAGCQHPRALGPCGLGLLSSLHPR